MAKRLERKPVSPRGQQATDCARIARTTKSPRGSSVIGAVLDLEIKLHDPIKRKAPSSGAVEVYPGVWGRAPKLTLSGSLKL